MLKILISNDDGFLSPGILALREGLRELGHVTVIAPESDFSGASSSLSLKTVLRLRQLDHDYFSLAGTPADCVHAALSGLLDFTPDLIVTGINNDSNLGDDIIYSGTFSAAYEGRHLRYPPIALSMARLNSEPHFATAVRVCRILIDAILKHAFNHACVLNVNIPDLPFEDLKGIKITRLGRRAISRQIERGTDPRGNDYFWLGARGQALDADDETTDFYAIQHHYVSVTPVGFEKIHEAAFNDLSMISFNF